MLGLIGKKLIHTIGVDISQDGIRLAQLADAGQEIHLMAGTLRRCPETIKPDSVQWQRWAIDTMREIISEDGFCGKAVTACIPSTQVFIKNMRIPKTTGDKLEDAMFARIKQAMPPGYCKENTMLKCVSTDQENGIVIAVDRETINRHLAIYEKSGLGIRSIGVWPEALVNCYVRFFGRRRTDRDAVVMLVNVEETCTDVVICRHANLLFAQSIPMGCKRLTDPDSINHYALEVAACRRDFAAMYRHVDIERLIFLSGQGTDTAIYGTVAKQLNIQAQIGDCLVAVEVPECLSKTLDRRDKHVSWAMAFGLSLAS
jgi:Tfp pilus assembly PilM family ATPase